MQPAGVSEHAFLACREFPGSSRRNFTGIELPSQGSGRVWERIVIGPNDRVTDLDGQFLRIELHRLDRHLMRRRL